MSFSWTDQQRVVAAKEGWGYRFVYSARLVMFYLYVLVNCFPVQFHLKFPPFMLAQVAVFLAADALFIGAQQLGRYIQELRSH